METKHSKGKWEVSSNFNQGFRILINQHDAIKQENICSVSGSPSNETVQANAKLIASSVCFFDYLCKKSLEGDKEAEQILKQKGYAKGEDY